MAKKSKDQLSTEEAAIPTESIADEAPSTPVEGVEPAPPPRVRSRIAEAEAALASLHTCMHGVQSDKCEDCSRKCTCGCSFGEHSATPPNRCVNHGSCGYFKAARG